jgi:hypothetical protein
MINREQGAMAELGLTGNSEYAAMAGLWLTGNREYAAMAGLWLTGNREYAAMTELWLTGNSQNAAMTELWSWKLWWKCWASFCYHTKTVSKNPVKLPYTYTLCVTFPTHNCPNIWQKILIMLTVTTFFSLYTPFSYQEIYWCKQ